MGGESGCQPLKGKKISKNNDEERSDKSHTSVLKNEREKDEERRRKKKKMKKEKKRKTTKTEQKIRYFLFYPLSFACFSPISFIIFFSVLPAIYNREQDGEKLRKKFSLLARALLHKEKKTKTVQFCN
jgi:hypothetical protein